MSSNGHAKLFVLDTNVLLHNPNALFMFKSNEVIIPFDVIEELDKFKAGTDDLGRNARTARRGGPVRVDLATVVRRAADLLQPAAQKKLQTLVLEVGHGLPRVLGNPDYLERAISNLIDNAIKYSPERGTIRVAVRQDAESVTVEIEDNGIGIPADDIARIFERFYRVDDARSTASGRVGLGLAIVKTIAGLHRGSAAIQSELGKGTRVTLMFPLSERGGSKDES